MEQIRTKSILCISLLSVVCLFACTTGEELDQPAGRYPMTFTATVDGLTLTRSDGKDAWTAGDKIAISVDEGANSKTYQIKDVSGAMEPATAGDGYYWQRNTDEMKILAWYPAGESTNVDISDQSEGFAKFDYLTVTATASFSGSATSSATELTFEHQMAKITCTLTAGNDITDLTNATVSIYGYTTLSFSKGTVTGSGNNGWITTTKTDRKALVVPQNMAGQKFIRVTIGGRDYFYTASSGEANLVAGNEYNCSITVTETGLEVTVDNSTNPVWSDSGSQDVDITEDNS